MKTMEHGNWFSVLDTKIGFAFGSICAVIKLIDITLLTDTYPIVVIKVLFTAVVGGFGGVAGKHLWTWCVAKWKEKFKNKKPKS